MLGPNGAGKTTCCGRWPGCCRSTTGRVELDGETWRTATGVHAARASAPVGVVFQDYLLFPHLSALRQRRVRPARPRRAGKAAARARGRRLAGPARAWPTHAGDRPAAAVRRPGAAGRAGPGAGHRPAAAAARRAAGRARRPHPARRARRAAPAPRRVRRATVAGHPRPGRRDGAGRPARRRRGRPGRPERTAGRGRPPARAPTTSPGWSGSTSTAARRRRPGRARRRRRAAAGRATPSGPVFVAVRAAGGGAAPGPTRARSPRNVWPGRVGGVDADGDRVRVARQRPAGPRSPTSRPPPSPSSGSPRRRGLGVGEGDRGHRLPGVGRRAVGWRSEPGR